MVDPEAPWKDWRSSEPGSGPVEPVNALPFLTSTSTSVTQAVSAGPLVPQLTWTRPAPLSTRSKLE